MRLIIVGGSLQGTEAAYLARKAGWESIVIDKNPAVPASGFCDRFVQLNVNDRHDWENLLRAVGPVDLVVPALENQTALDTLESWHLHSEIPFAYDPKAYAISSSKLKSRQLFRQLGLDMARPWPECGFPVLAKPDRGSGSQGVCVFHDHQQLTQRFPGPLPPQGWVLEEFLDGPAYSLEVVGLPGNYTALQTTDLLMDESRDCKRVTAPTILANHLVTEFENIGLRIAEGLALHGIMDVEVILYNNKLYLLEIDARLPSQTPTAVYHSSGWNILELTSACFTAAGKEASAAATKNPACLGSDQAVIYEHILVEDLKRRECGEHIISRAGPLSLYRDFCGAYEALTDYTPHNTRWAATLIHTGPFMTGVKQQRMNSITNLRPEATHDATD